LSLLIGIRMKIVAPMMIDSTRGHSGGSSYGDISEGDCRLQGNVALGRLDPTHASLQNVT
jgi:hypothetical protein